MDTITGLLADHGVEVLSEAAHPKRRFSWVSAFRDEDSQRTEETTVYIVDARTPPSDEALRLVVLGPYEKLEELPEGTLRPDDACVRTSCSCALVADRIQRFLARVIQWNDRMAAMVEEGCINQDLLKASEPMLHAFVALTDATYSYIAHTPNVEPLDETCSYLLEHRCYPTEAIGWARKQGLMRAWDHQDWTGVGEGDKGPIPYPTANRVIRKGGRYAAHLLMVSPTRLSATQLFLFELLAKKVEVCLARHWRRENPLEQRYHYFLREVLLGTISDEEQLAERAEAHGLPLTGLFELCLVEHPWQAGSAEYLAKQVMESEPSCRTAINKGRVAVLMCAPEGDRSRLAEMEEAVFGLISSLHLETGVSDTFGHLRWSALAVHKARVALKYGRRRSQRYEPFDDPGSRTREVLRFQRYFPYFATDPYGNAERFCADFLASPHPLARLREADEKRGTCDLEILRMYLRSEGHVGEVCERMHMHRNTVAYRLRKVRALLDEDIDDPDVRLYLRTLYLMME